MRTSSSTPLSPPYAHCLQTRCSLSLPKRCHLPTQLCRCSRQGQIHITPSSGCLSCLLQPLQYLVHVLRTLCSCWTGLNIFLEKLRLGSTYIGSRLTSMSRSGVQDCLPRFPVQPFSDFETKQVTYEKRPLLTRFTALQTGCAPHSRAQRRRGGGDFLRPRVLVPQQTRELPGH